MPIQRVFSITRKCREEGKERGATDAEIEVYLKKIKGIETSYDFGDLVMTLPDNFKTDEADLETSSED